MRVSAKAEYACVAMVELARQFDKGQPVSIKVIADGYGISPGFLIQILLQLKGAGLVASSRGAAGGYQLAQSPERISLAEIIEVIDGPRDGGSSLAALPESPVVKVIEAAWQEVQRTERGILSQKTLAELLRQAQEGEASVYQI